MVLTEQCLSEQGNFAIKGTQKIDKESYRLQIEGEVEEPANFTYKQITSYPSKSKVVQLFSVDGWRFTAKWTGVPIETLFNKVGANKNANTVIFYGVDGFSTYSKWIICWKTT
ncbi:molybdopterin-dependent oxidoreductase [Methanohalobium evestigatum]|uniref:molybdopterin-dependent oxidoreductase n=1 Tax=Methanohalobium evestigatum TaxID=2322 RepID=UPI002FBDB22E